MFNFQVEQMKNAGGEQAEQANQVNQSKKYFCLKINILCETVFLQCSALL